MPESDGSVLIRRPVDEARVAAALGRAPIVLVLGPRQAGKTTLARDLVRVDRPHMFDAEYPPDARQLADPALALANLEGTVVIDEAQLVEGLFPVLRVLADRRPTRTRFLILGSASADLVGMASQTLAGRVEILELGGLRVGDVGRSETDRIDRLWLRGGFPPSYLAPDENASSVWRDNYITTFLGSDLPRLGSRVPTATMRRAWTMLSHYHGQTWNSAEFARALDVDAKSARRYLDQLADALVIRQLLPWFTNSAKRQVKSPKVYVRDSGILHRLQFIEGMADLLSRPIVGASWEGFVVEQIGALLGGHPMYFWRTQQGAEIDVFVQIEGRNYGVEIKRSSAPGMTKSIRIAIEDLDLAHVAVAYPGTRRYQLAPNVTVVPAHELVAGSTPGDLVQAIAG